jgi:hypothetical protein
VAAGVVAASVGYRIVGWYPELRLLVAVAAFCAAAVTVCAVVDRAYWRSRCGEVTPAAAGAAPYWR